MQFWNPAASGVLLVKPARSLRLLAAVCASLQLSGCFGFDSRCSGCGGYEKPVYMSYDELRSSVSLQDPQPVEDISRVYVYKTYVLLNKKNSGLHVIDNSNRENPENVAFINIPGNTELSIRDDALYADSYVDLVTLAINEDGVFEEVNREPDIFPYDEYQNVPSSVYFGYGAIDQEKGVVVSYVRR